MPWPIAAVAAMAALNAAVIAGTFTFWWAAGAIVLVAGALYWTIVLPSALIVAVVGASLASLALANLVVVSSLLASLAAAASTAAVAGALLLALGGGGSLLGWGPDDEGPGRSAAESDEAPIRDPDALRALESWDQRFASRELRFSELSPRSPFRDTRAFIKQQGLDVKTGGRSREDVYAELAALFGQR